jgi:AAA domain-containing protein
MSNSMMIKFNEAVWHDQPYLHPQLATQVEKDFYGRVEQKERAEAILRSESRKPAIIVGERRAGKTSMLKLLSYRLANDPSGQFVPVLVPWQGIRSRDELAEEILQGICSGLDIEPPDVNHLHGASTQRDATATEFIKTMRQLLAPISNKIVVICIDEFDSIVEEAVQPEKSRILGLMNTLVEITDLPIRLLLTMSRLMDIPEARSSPLIAKSEQIHLHPFSKADLDAMVKGLLGQEIPPQDLQRLFELSGGWPYFAKLLLIYLAELTPDETWIDRALGRAIAHAGVELTLENIYTKHFDDGEKALVLLLAQRGSAISTEEMSVVGVSLRTAAAGLAQRDFVSKDDSGSGYHFRVGFLAKWFPKWVKFEEEVENRLKDILQRIERLRDP